MNSLGKTGSAATITDVARRSGVSIKTVSRVINQELVFTRTPATRYYKVVAELKYRPVVGSAARPVPAVLIGLLYYDPARRAGDVQRG